MYTAGASVQSPLRLQPSPHSWNHSDLEIARRLCRQSPTRRGTGNDPSAVGPTNFAGKLAALDDPRSVRRRHHSLASEPMPHPSAHWPAWVAGSPVPPSECAPPLSPATIRRVLLCLDPETLAVLARPDVLQVMALDGKSLHGTMHLLATLPPDRHLTAKVRVPAGTSEIDTLATLLEGVVLAGVVVTVEELHADYLLTVKRNPKTLFEQFVALLWVQSPTLGTARAHGDGWAQTRTITGRTDFPHVA